ncbi:Complex 1 protein (LYR family) [Ceratobasidium sp. AG-Ba]|nr:Complex 1 protein (LYR family) [Ceratobasidium sp. AG-Ba]QRW08565.1 Complex 1 protein (LYR family) [Ceratobasidium sp. AG-Ba]
MHSSLRLLAQSVSTKPLNLREASATLLPPKPLMRRLLRAHRRLPIEMRSLGDDYVKSEFRRHQQVDNPVHIIGFLSQWKLYLDQLESVSPEESQKFRGRKMDPTVFEQLSSEQIGQMYELMHAAKDIWKPVETLAAEADAEAGDAKN